MSACPQCGTVAKPTDKFCNVCGTPIARAGAPSAPPGPPAFGAPPPAYPAPSFPGAPGGPPPPQGGYVPPPAFAPSGPAARCQQGHEIAPGASYCVQGHPIALDQMQFASDAYGAPGGGFGQQPGFPPPPQGPYGAPPPPPGYGAPPPPFPQAGPPGFGQPNQPQGFGQPNQFGPPNQQGFGGQSPPQGFVPPQPPPFAPQQGGGYGQPPPYGAPQGPPQGVPQGAPAPFGAEPSRDVPAKILRGFLVSYGTNASGDSWSLTGGRHVVGRMGTGDGIDIPLQDPTISSRHAALVIDAPTGSVTIEDTGSTNGTFVNDEHIGFNGRRELHDGDRLRFGGYTTVVKVIGRV